MEADGRAAAIRAQGEAEAEIIFKKGEARQAGQGAGMDLVVPGPGGAGQVRAATLAQVPGQGQAFARRDHASRRFPARGIGRTMQVAQHGPPRIGVEFAGRVGEIGQGQAGLDQLLPRTLGEALGNVPGDA